MSAITSQSAAGLSDAPISGGKVHVRHAIADGVEYRVEMQFFPTRHSGQCWNSLARDGAGRIYLGNSTHKDNSYVYRYDPAAGQMRCLGDLLSNIRYGGRGGTDNGKIHSPFVEGPGGSFYFLSHCGGDEDIRYGGHLWRLDPRTDRIIDLGVPVPGNTNFVLSQPRDGIAYTCSTPSGLFIRCDLNAGTFTPVEKTDMGWVRHMPDDLEGNLYICWANRIRKFDPAVGRWQVVATNPQTHPDRTIGPVPGFTWSADSTRLYFVSHVQGNLFRWTVGSPTIEPLGKLHPDRRPVYLHSIHLNAAETRLYGMGGTGKKTDKGFYVYDLVRRRSHKLFSLDAILAHELAGHFDGDVYVDFGDYGGVTGDDGTMYFGFFGGDADQDQDPGGKTVVALVAVRATHSEGGPPAAGPAPARTAQPARRPAIARDARAAQQPAAASGSQTSPQAEVAGTGVVVDYRMADRPADRNGEGQLPLAYWLRLTPVDASRDQTVLLYAHIGATDNGPTRFLPGGKVNLLPEARTVHNPFFDKYLLPGRRVRYRGRAVLAGGDQPAYVDTAVPGGRIEIVFDAEPVARLAQMVVGNSVTFDGVIEPRRAWMAPFEGEDWWQDWQVIATLPGGEEIDLGDRLLIESYNFRRCLALVRQQKRVCVRVVGQVWSAQPLRARIAEFKCQGTPRDIRGNVLIAVEELLLLTDEPADQVLE